MSPHQKAAAKHDVWTLGAASTAAGTSAAYTAASMQQAPSKLPGAAVTTTGAPAAPAMGGGASAPAPAATAQASVVAAATEDGGEGEEDGDAPYLGDAAARKAFRAAALQAAGSNNRPMEQKLQDQSAKMPGLGASAAGAAGADAKMAGPPAVHPDPGTADHATSV